MKRTRETRGQYKYKRGETARRRRERGETSLIESREVPRPKGAPVLQHQSGVDIPGRMAKNKIRLDGMGADRDQPATSRTKSRESERARDTADERHTSSVEPGRKAPDDESYREAMSSPRDVHQISDESTETRPRRIK